jgi:hypothetical protein
MILLTHKVAGVVEPEPIEVMVVFEQMQYDDSRNAYHRLHQVTTKIKLRAIFGANDS